MLYRPLVAHRQTTTHLTHEYHGDTFHMGQALRYNTISSGVSLQSGDAVEVCRSDPETDDSLQGGTDPRSVGSGHCRPLRVSLTCVLSAGFL